ncbi:MAG: DUF4266 domain-containing protein, partial [Fibrobacteria bacterium]
MLASLPRFRSPASIGAADVFRLTGLLAGAAWLCLCCGCARMHQKDREFLSDPIMQRTPDPMGSGMESHNLPRREGSAGGS